MRLGDLDSLKEEVVKLCEQINANNGITVPTLAFTRIIDNALTVETYTIEDIQEVHENALILGAKLAQRPQGEWSITNEFDEFYGRVYKCTHCGEETLACDCRNFCSWCGALMKKGGKEE